MAAAWKMDIEVARSGAQQFTLLFKDVSGLPVNLTGVTPTMSFYYANCEDDPLVVAGLETDGSATGLAWVDPANGHALVTIYGSDFESVDCNCQPEKLVHKIILTQTGEPPLLVYGQFKLLPE